MAPKRTGDTPKASNKIRFIMLEADLADGNLSDFTQAITSALKPQGQQVRYIQAPIMPKTLNGNVDATAPEDEEETIENDGEDAGSGEPQASPKSIRQAGKRKYKQPELVELDWAGSGSPTFKEFAKEKAPKSKARKYLVATLWLKEYGGQPTVNADKMYSCFRTAGWPVGFADWGQTFHNLVHSDHLRKATTTGEFSITTIGEGLLAQAEN